jgi:phage terminase large subunit-like protein
MQLPRAARAKYEEFMNEGSLSILNGSVLDMMEVYEDLDNFIAENDYNVCCFGFDPYNAEAFVDRWCRENGSFGVEKVRQGSRTESVPLGELKKLAEERFLLFDEKIMTFTLGNAITIEDTNGNRKLWKRRREDKIDNVAALIDAYVVYKNNRDAFE